MTYFSQKGFSILEIILAAALFVIFATGAVIAIVSSYNTNRLGAEETIANQFNVEGMEAVRSIKNQSFGLLANVAGAGNQGVAVTNGTWSWSGTSNTLVHNSTDNYTRTIAVTSVQRDGSGNIVSSAGTYDANTYKVVSTVAWNFNAARPESVVLTEYMTNWKIKRGGMLVYGDGGTTTDTMRYKVFDANANTWGASQTNPGTVTLGDSKTDSQTGLSTRTTTNVTITARPNMYLFVSNNTTGASVTSVTWGGTALTKLSSQACSSGCNTEIWYLKNPTPGTNSIVSTYSGATNSVIGITTYYNINWSNPFNTPVTAITTGGTSVTANVTTISSNQTVIDSVGVNLNTSPVNGASQTQSYLNGSTAIAGSGSYEPGSWGTVAMSWTNGSSLNWSEVAVALNPSPVFAAPQFDAKSQLTGTSVSTLSWSHITGVQSNLVLVVSIQIDAVGVTVSSVTYNGVGLTKAGNLAGTCNGVANECDAEIWYLVNPPTGTNTVLVTASGTATNLNGAAATFYNVDQTTPLVTPAITSSGNTTTHSVTVNTTNPNQIIIDSIADTKTITPASSQSAIENWTASKITAGASYRYASQSATTMIWTPSSSTTYVMAAAAINPVLSGLTAHVDPNTTNKAVRAIRVYSSSTRNEKILLSSNYDGTKRTLYAQVWNGSGWAFVNQLAASVATNSALDIQDFDGTYLNNGDFMAVFSDGTSTPRFKTWNGTVWSTSSGTPGTSMWALTGVPVYIVASQRPSSNEVMAAFFNNAKGTQTEYFNGGVYNNADWSNPAPHGTLAPNTLNRLVDFAWANTATIGALVFSNSNTDKTIRVQTGTANAGVFTFWGNTGLSAAQTNNLGSLNIAARPNSTTEFVACDKDAGATPSIICYQVSNGATPTFSAATTLTAATDTGIERSFQSSYKSISTSGFTGLTVYSDNTSTPKYKKFVSNPVTWDSSATSITTTGFTPGVFTAIRTIPQTQGNDMMFLMADTNRALYSVLYNASADAVYTVPAGNAFSRHGINGSAISEFWFDYAWDNY